MSRPPWPVRVYAAMLRAFPGSFRRRYGGEMVDFFEDAWRSARGFGRWLVVSRAVRDALVHGWLERVGWGRPPGGWRGMMGGLGQDVRYAARTIRRRPGFALVAVLTMGLGIGSASAVFAVVDAVVFRPLPYPDVDRLVSMWTRFEGQGDFGMSLAEHYDYASESRALEALGSYSTGSTTLTGRGEARRVDQVQTWGRLYEVIGARTTLGRLPGEADTQGGAAPVVVVSHDFWTSDLAADPGAVGRTLELNGATVEIVGVMAPDVRLPNGAPALWRPIALDRADIGDRSGHFLEGVGRLAPGATLATLRAEIDRTHERWHDEWAGAHSPGHEGHVFAAAGLHERQFGPLRSAGTLLLAGILCVLLLACANVAALLLARGEARAGDISLRRALGASRGRIACQLLVESLVLAMLGGGLGLLLAPFGAEALMALEPGNLPRTDTVGLDGRVAVFALLIAALSGLAFGVLPAMRGGASPTRSRGSTGPDRSLSRSLSSLVVAQVALAVVLVAGAGLLTRSVSALSEADVGLEVQGRLTFQVSLSPEAYPDRPAVTAFWSRLLSDVEALPGVDRAAAVRLLPLRDGLRREGMRVEGRELLPGDAGAVAYGTVTPGYFATLGIPVVAGRAFEPSDDAEAPWVGLVNEAAARAFWPGQDPLGQRVRPLFMPEAAGPVTIVGVVGDVRAEGARAPVTPELYLAYAQVPSNVGYLRSGVVTLAASVEPTSLLPAVRRVVAAIDPRIPVTEAATLDEVVATARARERFLATVMGLFAALALAIAVTGTYGVVAYAVARRTREFGVRIALGAGRDQVVGAVVRSGATLALAGGALGLGAALLAGPVVGGFLFGVAPRDPTALAAGPLTLTVAVVLASLVPALRASRVDPLEALRDER